MTPAEFQQHVHQETAYSPVFKAATWVGNSLPQEEIVDSGASAT
jgi:hypothetical protein